LLDKIAISIYFYVATRESGFFGKKRMAYMAVCLSSLAEHVRLLLGKKIVPAEGLVIFDY
jgi:hypothetical protein